MPKCIMCDMESVVWQHNMPNTIEQAWNIICMVENTMEPVVDWSKHDEYTINMANRPIPMICELCWYAIMGNSDEYIWNGQYLLVFDYNDGEFHEWKQTIFKPSNIKQIYFKWDERSKRWMTMPR